MNRPRLERLIKVLEQVTEPQFDMKTWAVNRCGTTCCACGHAALDPELHSQGFNLRLRNEDFSTSVCDSYSDLADADYKASISLEYAGFHNFEAACKFFGISLDMSEYLFSAHTYREAVRPLDVISRIRRMLDDDDDNYEGKENTT